jgi:ribosomal-protein-alanine N-acetyltransferase
MLLSDFEEIDLNEDYILRRPIADKNDAETLLRMYENPLVAKYIPDDLMPNDMKSSIETIEYYRNAINGGNMAYWSIARKDNNKMIGLIGFCDINRYNGRAEIAYELDPQYWRKGITLMAVKKISQIMFEKIGIKRIQANIIPDNIGSLGLLSKAGFVTEGLLYSYRVFKGKQVDVVMVALSADKYFNDIRIKSQTKISWKYIPSHNEVVNKFRNTEKYIAN